MMLNGYQSYLSDRSHSKGMDLINNAIYVCVCANASLWQDMYTHHLY